MAIVPKKVIQDLITDVTATAVAGVGTTATIVGSYKTPEPNETQVIG